MRAPPACLHQPTSLLQVSTQSAIVHCCSQPLQITTGHRRKFYRTDWQFLTSLSGRACHLQHSLATWRVNLHPRQSKRCRRRRQSFKKKLQNSGNYRKVCPPCMCLAVSHMSYAMTRIRTNMHTETQKCTASRQQLDGQLNENKTVKEVRVIKIIGYWSGRIKVWQWLE